MTVLSLTRSDHIDHFIETATGSVYHLVWDPENQKGHRVRRPNNDNAMPGHVGISHIRDGQRIDVLDVLVVTVGHDMVLHQVRIDGVPVTANSTTVVGIRPAAA
jgi:hypothetical protein